MRDRNLCPLCYNEIDEFEKFVTIQLLKIESFMVKVICFRICYTCGKKVWNEIRVLKGLKSESGIS